MPQRDAYIIAARRTALGRVGGLHARRRIEELAVPVVTSALSDGRVKPSLVDGLILGNGSEPSNPARLVALAAGLPESVDAMTLDRQCAGGLDAIVIACRQIAMGDADVIVAGGAEALSTAPWRVARPKHVHQMPRFLGFEPTTSDSDEGPQLFEASERLARELQLTREMLDRAALASHKAAMAARDSRRFVGEIVPLRQTSEETRDELVRDLEFDDLARLSPLNGSGPLTAGNTAQNADGAALVVVVSSEVWADLGQPRALRYVRSANVGVTADREAAAAVSAIDRLKTLDSEFDASSVAALETSETCPAQVTALSRRFGIAESEINRTGGAVARGHPMAAAGAVLAVRLFSDLARAPLPGIERGARGLATLSAAGGLGTATLFEAA